MLHIFGAFQPFTVRMPPHNTGRGAGRVEQDAVERLLIPPHRGLAGVFRKQVDAGTWQVRQAQPIQVLPDTTQTPGITIQRDQIEIGTFKQVAGFTARGGARIQHAHARLRFEQKCRRLRPQILHGNQALRETGEFGNRNRGVQHQGVLTQFVVRLSSFIKLGAIVRRRNLATVDAQGHRRPGIQGGHDAFPSGRVFGLQPRQPPGREIPARFRILTRGVFQFLAATLEVTQHGVDERTCVRITARCDIHRFIDGGIRGGEAGVELVQTDQQVSVQFIGLNRTLGQFGEKETQPTGLAQDAISQILRGGKVTAIRDAASAQVGKRGSETVTVVEDGIDQIGGQKARRSGRSRHLGIVAQAGMIALRECTQEFRLAADSNHMRADQRFSCLWRPAMNNVETLRHDLVGIVSELHTALREIGSEQLPQTGIVNNTRDRLRYIATLTEQAASQTLHAAESISDSLHEQQTAARGLLSKVRSPDARAFLQTLDAQHQQALGQVSNIIQAQAFQDLVGQVINKLMLTIEKMETSLAHLLLEEEADPGLLAGPQVRSDEQISQVDIDNLFD